MNLELHVPTSDDCFGPGFGVGIFEARGESVAKLQGVDISLRAKAKRRPISDRLVVIGGQPDERCNCKWRVVAGEREDDAVTHIRHRVGCQRDHRRELIAHSKMAERHRRRGQDRGIGITQQSRDMRYRTFAK